MSLLHRFVYVTASAKHFGRWQNAPESVVSTEPNTLERYAAEAAAVGKLMVGPSMTIAFGPNGESRYVNGAAIEWIEFEYRDE